jgi:DNA-binding cell septation regulator SpoVG
MFSKKEGFKYESEVSALIKVATDHLNQRIIALELQNNQLIINNQRLEVELVQLKNGLYNDVYRLEKRITDFTDIWHPIMAENINRIKTDLEKTIIETERKDIKNIREELEIKLKKIVEDNNYTNEQVLIGYDSSSSCLPPLFTHINIASMREGNLYQAISERFSGSFYNIHFIIDSLEYLKDIKYIDLRQFFNITIINKYGTIIRQRNPIETIDFNDTSLKIIKNYCDKFSIKILFESKEFYNGILLLNLIDKIGL